MRWNGRGRRAVGSGAGAARNAYRAGALSWVPALLFSPTSHRPLSTSLGGDGTLLPSQSGQGYPFLTVSSLSRLCFLAGVLQGASGLSFNRNTRGYDSDTLTQGREPVPSFLFPALFCCYAVSVISWAGAPYHGSRPLSMRTKGAFGYAAQEQAPKQA